MYPANRCKLCTTRPGSGSLRPTCALRFTDDRHEPPITSANVEPRSDASPREELSPLRDRNSGAWLGRERPDRLVPSRTLRSGIECKRCGDLGPAPGHFAQAKCSSAARPEHSRIPRCVAGSRSPIRSSGQRRAGAGTKSGVCGVWTGGDAWNAGSNPTGAARPASSSSRLT